MIRTHMRTGRWLAALLAVVIALASALPAPASAAAAGEEASLTVRASDEVRALTGLELSVYRVGEIEPDGTPELLPAFAGYGVALDPADTATWKAAAETLASYITRDRATPDESRSVGSDGLARFDGLETGLYLVRGECLEGADFTYDPEPFLIALPRAAATGAEYDVTVAIKGEGAPRSAETTSLKVVKVWRGQADESQIPASIDVDLLRDGGLDETVTLSAATGWRHVWEDLEAGHTWSVVEHEVPRGWALTSSREGNAILLTNRYEVTKASVKKVWRDGANASSRPKSVDVALLRDGKEFETVTLSEANGWSHSWDALEAGHAWSVAEPRVPAGYVSEVTQDGTAFTVTNTFGPRTSLLPKTGDIWWPVPVLLSAGMLCYLFARVSRRREAR